MEIFRKIEEQFDGLLQAALRALSEEIHATKTGSVATDLQLDGIDVGPNEEPSSFTFTFHLKSDPNESLFVDFANFQIEDS